MDTIPGALAMSAENLRALLHRVAAGEDPDMVLIEEIANAEQGPLHDWIDRQDANG